MQLKFSVKIKGATVLAVCCIVEWFNCAGILFNSRYVRMDKRHFHQCMFAETSSNFSLEWNTKLSSNADKRKLKKTMKKKHLKR